MKWPVAVVGFLTTALGAAPDEGHKHIRRLRAVTVKHMGDLWAAQVTRRREADDSIIMEAGFQVALFFGSSILPRKWLAKMTKTRRNGNET